MGLLFFYSAFSLIPIKISLHLHQPISTLSLSLPCSTISLLSLPLLHVIASLSDETQAGASSQADLETQFGSEWVGQLVMGKLMVGELVMGELLVGESLVVLISILICFCFWFCFSVLVVVI